MNAIVACLIVGLILGTVITGLGSVALTRPGVGPDMAARWGGQIPFILFTVGLSCGGIMVGGALGTLAGLTYYLFERAAPGHGFGSPNVAYTSLIIFTGISAGVALVLVRRRAGIAVILVVLSTIALGWLLPWMAA